MFVDRRSDVFKSC